VIALSEVRLPLTVTTFTTTRAIALTPARTRGRAREGLSLQALHGDVVTSRVTAGRRSAGRHPAVVDGRWWVTR
jgi:hypothetical protein